MSLMPIISNREGPSLTYVGTGANADNQSTYTFSAVSFGAPELGRYMVAAIAMRDDNSSGQTNSVTIGGVSATRVVSLAKTFGSSNAVDASIWIAAVPTGTSGDVVATMQTTSGSCGLALYRLTGIASPTAAATASNSTGGATSLDVSLNTLNRGMAIGISAVSSTQALGWSGLTEDVETQVQTGGINANLRFSGASLLLTATETPRSISATLAASADAGTAVVATWTPM